MFRNFFITALRNIVRNKLQSVIQVISLSTGIAVLILIGLYAHYEYTYDRYNEKSDRIYRIEIDNSVGMPSGIGHLIKQEFPEVEQVVRLVNWYGRGRTWTVVRPQTDSTPEIKYYMKHFFYCDSTIFDVFDFYFIQGDPKHALDDPNSLVISKSTARRIFGRDDPVGQILSGQTITGVFEDISHSHIDVNILEPFTQWQSWSEDYEHDLNAFGLELHFMTYVVLAQGVHPATVERKLNEIARQRNDEYFLDRTSHEGEEFHLRPLKEIYFARGLTGEENYCRHGNITQVRIFLIIAFIMMLMAIVNYVNLTTARISLRAREVGIRKVAGSSKSTLVLQFLVESVLVSWFSLLVALTLVQLLIPGFDEVALTTLDSSMILEPANLAAFLVTGTLIGIVAGLYPAIRLTRPKPVTALQEQGMKGSGSYFFRRVMLTFQFTVSIMLIISIILVYKQLNFMKHMDLGFNDELIVTVALGGTFGGDDDFQQLYRERLMQRPAIKGVTFTHSVMGGEVVRMGLEYDTAGRGKNVTIMSIDPDFLDVFEIKLLEGQNFSWDRTAETAWWSQGQGEGIKYWLVNEAFHEQMHFDVGSVYDRNYVLGIIDDFHFNSPREPIEPCMYQWGGYRGVANIKISPDDIASTLKFIRETSYEMTDQFQQVEFLEDRYNQQYLKDERNVILIGIFALLAIMIACLGLFGLASFMAERKIKEIGIRKTMGASDQSLFLFLSREFIKWVALSIVIALPIAWFLMNKWLQGYAYKTGFSWWIFAAAILLALIITFLTVTWQSLKTARTNPVEALRYE